MNEDDLHRSAAALSLEDTGMTLEEYCKVKKKQKEKEALEQNNNEEWYRRWQLILTEKRAKEELQKIETIIRLGDDERISAIVAEYGSKEEDCDWVVLDEDTEKQLKKLGMKDNELSVTELRPADFSTPEAKEHIRHHLECRKEILLEYLPKGTKLEIIEGKDAAEFPVYITVGVTAEADKAIINMHYIREKCKRIQEAMERQKRGAEISRR